MKIEAKAPGKLILLGEYAVLEGAPALVMAVNRFAKVNLEYLSSTTSKIHAPEININQIPFVFDSKGRIKFPERLTENEINKLNFVINCLHYAFNKYKKRNRSFPALNITLDTSSFFENNIKMGLGSSAALTSAFLASFLLSPENINRTREDKLSIFDAAVQVHYLSQKNIGSGIDIAASVFGGVIYFQKLNSNHNNSARIEQLTLPANLHILPVWTQKEASTREFLEKYNYFKQAEPEKHTLLINELSGISQNGSEAIRNNDISKFLTEIDNYFQGMLKLGEACHSPIVSNEHKKIAEKVSKLGGVYKPSGAGGGDFGLAFCDSSKTAEKICFYLEETSFKLTSLNVSNAGIQIKYSKG